MTRLRKLCQYVYMDNDDVNIGAGAPTAVPNPSPAVTGTEPANSSVNPLGNLEDAVAAAQAAQPTPETPAVNPQEQFNAQFGSGITPPPVSETPTNAPAAPQAAENPNPAVVTPTPEPTAQPEDPKAIKEKPALLRPKILQLLFRQQLPLNLKG